MKRFPAASVIGVALAGILLAVRAGAPATGTAVTQQAYVISCTPYTPQGTTLYPVTWDYFPHVFDGSLSDAQAYAKGHQGCWQTIAGAGTPTTSTTTTSATTTTTRPATSHQWCKAHPHYVGPRCPNRHKGAG